MSETEKAYRCGKGRSSTPRRSWSGPGGGARREGAQPGPADGRTQVGRQTDGRGAGVRGQGPWGRRTVEYRRTVSSGPVSRDAATRKISAKFKR